MYRHFWSAQSPLTPDFSPLAPLQIAHDHHHTAHITAHGPWDGRSFGAVPAPVVEQPQQMAQNLAYQAYV